MRSTFSWTKRWCVNLCFTLNQWDLTLLIPWPFSPAQSIELWISCVKYLWQAELFSIGTYILHQFPTCAQGARVWLSSRLLLKFMSKQVQAKNFDEYTIIFHLWQGQNWTQTWRNMIYQKVFFPHLLCILSVWSLSNKLVGNTLFSSRQLHIF